MCIVPFGIFAQTPDQTPADDFVITRVIDVRGHAGSQGKTWDFVAVEMYAIHDIDRDYYEFVFSSDAGVTTKIKSMNTGLFAKHLIAVDDYGSHTASSQIIPEGSYFYAVEMYRVDSGPTYIKLDNNAFYRIIDETIGISINMHFAVSTGQSDWAHLYSTLDNSNTWLGLHASSLEDTPTFSLFDQWKGPLSNHKYDERINKTANAVFAPEEWNRNLDSGAGVRLGVKNVNDLSVFVYPNPVSHGKVYLSDWDGKKTAHVYDVNGRLLIDQQVDHELEVSALSKGIYVLKLFQEDQLVIKKLIIQD